MKRMAIVGAMVLLSSTAANARGTCYNVEIPFAGGAFGLATVKTARSTFYDGDGHKTGSYVVRGNQLVTGERDGDYICATYQSRSGTSAAGWIKWSDVAVMPSKAMLAKDWLGKWTAGEWNNISFKKGSKPDWLSVAGSAFWDPRGNKRAGDEAMYSGGFDGAAPVIDNTVGFTQTDDQQFQPFDEKAKDSIKCAARFRILSPRYLVAEDSGNCGGAHISFLGLYVKAN